MSIADLLIPNSVVRNIEVRSKKHAVDVLSELLANSTGGVDAGEAFASLIAREKLGSTALGHGVAIPHGRLDGLDESVGALLKLAVPIDFDAPDEQPVDLLFGLLVPKDSGDEHLQDLAAIARLMSDPLLRSHLRAATSSRALFHTICNYVPVAQASGG